MNRYLTDDQIARRLAAYADLRLSPTAEATARMRARVVAAAAAMPAGRSTGATQPISLARRRAPFVRRSRVFGALMAAALSVLLVAGVALASSAGGPLYGVRLWVESVALPSEPAARADADVDRLDARVGEAVSAARDGNAAGTAAALSAYREILDDALVAASQLDSRSERLEAALARHQLVLATLLAYAPEPARDALQRAIERSNQAIEGISAGRGNSGGNPGNPGNAGNGGGHPVARPTPRGPDGHGPAPTPRRTPPSRSHP